MIENLKSIKFKTFSREKYSIKIRHDRLLIMTFKTHLQSKVEINN